MEVSFTNYELEQMDKALAFANPRRVENGREPLDREKLVRHAVHNWLRVHQQNLNEAAALTPTTP